jgi:hypothetical protein
MDTYTIDEKMTVMTSISAAVFSALEIGSYFQWFI